MSLQAARDNRFAIDWSTTKPVKPTFLGTRTFKAYKLAELVPYIDWTPFFQTWELQGKYPRILEDNVVGAEAKKLFADAQAMLKRIVDEKWLTANAVVGFWPANAVGDDIELFTDDTRKTRAGHPAHAAPADGAREPPRPGQHRAVRFHRAPSRPAWPTTSAPSPSRPASARPRRMAKYIDKTDDYSRIMLKALADRLAEAFAERLHERVRRELWGYAKGETLTNEELIAEQYRGIRPAPGYPAQPDHTEKAHHLPPARRRDEGRHPAHRELRHVAGRRRVRPLLRAPGEPLLRRRQGRARPGRGLCPAQGLDPG